MELAIAADVPIVPVRFAGALPREAGATRLEFPVGLGAQDIHLGHALLPETLRPLSLVDKKTAILNAINGAGARPEDETPLAPSPELAAGVAKLRERLNLAEVSAVALAVLARRASLADETRGLFSGIAAGRREFGSDASGRWMTALASWLTESEPPPS